jgi:RHS repeat-associated protein
LVTRVEITDLSGGVTSASQSFGYDRYGNRWVTSATGGVSGYWPSYNTTNNRISNLAYDAAGNITNDPVTGGTMIYDGESRLVMATNGGGGAYTYDGEGKRVKRMLAGGQEWWYVYGIGGELLAEYLATAPTTVKKEYGYRDGQLLVVWNGDESTADKKLKWLVQDHLGSTRMEADKSGSLAGMTRYDYAPFGEELLAGIRKDAQGQPQYGYTASSVRQKFGSKERDNETGLDYFLARYHSSVQGRFVSVDPENAGAIPDDPQSWNGYAYARNGPVVYSDPDGRKFLVCTPDGKECYEHSDKDFYAGRRSGEKGGYTFTGDRKFFERGEIRDQDGNVIATYQQTSIDDRAAELAFEMQVQFNSPDLYKRAAGNLISAAIIGHTLGRTISPSKVTTRSPSRSAALQEAKLANDIPVSRQPDKVIKPNTPEGREAGLRSGENVRLYEYTNSRGQKIWIREDNATLYGSPGGRGDQGPHFNSGPKGEKLRNHHYWEQ